MEAIVMTEDRQKFAEELASIGEPVAPSKAAYTVKEVCVCGGGGGGGGGGRGGERG